MPRKRSFIFDSSVVYAGIDTVANSNSINTIAGGDVGKKLKVIEIFVFSDNNLFVDVTAVGLTRPGLGLRWLITYY